MENKKDWERERKEKCTKAFIDPLRSMAFKSWGELHPAIYYSYVLYTHSFKLFLFFFKQFSLILHM